MDHRLVIISQFDRVHVGSSFRWRICEIRKNCSVPHSCLTEKAPIATRTQKRVMTIARKGARRLRSSDPPWCVAMRFVSIDFIRIQRRRVFFGLPTCLTQHSFVSNNITFHVDVVLLTSIVLFDGENPRETYYLKEHLLLRFQALSFHISARQIYDTCTS